MTLSRLTGIAAGMSLCAFLCACSPSPKPARMEAGPRLKEAKNRRPAPDFALKDADGRTVRLSDYRGKVVLLGFFATWCHPCKIEVPWFMQFEREHRDKGFAVIGVSMDEQGWSVVKPYLAELGINYRVVMGDDATSASFGGVDSLPTTFLIDREGRVAARHVGVASRDDIEDGIEELLQAGAGRASGFRSVAFPAWIVGAR